MKKIFQFFILVAFVSITQVSIAQKKEWKEMHDFHTVMSKTFHPAEEGNMGPLRANASLLLSKAKKWQAAAVPEGYDATITKPILQQLVEECKTIKEAEKNKKTNDELKTLITKAHETFHKIMEKCRK